MANTMQTDITAVAGMWMTLRSVPSPAARASRGRIGKSTPPREAEGRVSEQHGSGDARSSFRTGRCPDAPHEGRHKQGIRDAIQRNHEGSRWSPLSRQLTEGLISVAVARIS